MCIFKVVGVTGGGVTRLRGGRPRAGQSGPRPRRLVAVGPGGPVTGRSYWPQLWLQLDRRRRRPSLPPADVEEEPQLGAEGWIQTAVDERVVASGAHGQPVEAEVQGVRGVDGLAGQQHHVAVEGEPADCKHPDHQQQHGQRPPPLSPLRSVLRRCGVTDGVVAPQPTGHCGVGGGDDEEWQHVKQYEGQEVNILPVDLCGLWEVWDTKTALFFLAGEVCYGGSKKDRLVSKH